MEKNLIFQYLKNEQLHIDKSEFNFQFESHPDYPTLLAISDTLNFFKIKNGVFIVGETEIDLLPSNFVGLLKNENKTNSFLSYITKKENVFEYTFEGFDKPKKTTKEEFLKYWDNTVLLVESDDSEILKTKSNPKSKILISLCSLLFILLLFLKSTSFLNSLFLIFPILGFLLSVAALKDLF